MKDEILINRICKKVLDYLNEEDYCNLTKEEFVEEQLREDLEEFAKNTNQESNHTQPEEITHKAGVELQPSLSETSGRVLKSEVKE